MKLRLGTYQVGDLTEWVLLQVFWSLRLSSYEVDRDNFHRHSELLGDDQDALRANRHKGPVEFEDHC